MNDLLKSELIYDGIWQITGPANDLMYLVTGTKKAMLVDTGMGVGDLRGVVKKISSLPLIVINTHGHPDHAGGNGNFDQAWLNPQDLEIMKVMCSDEYRSEDIHKASPANGSEISSLIHAMVSYKEIDLLPYQKGTRFDLGDRGFSAIEIPGHTPGSMGLYNSNEKILFAGDSIVYSPVWMYLNHSLSIQTYYDALLHLREGIPEIKTIFTGHLPTLATPDLLDDLILCAQEIIQNPGIGEVTKTFAGQGLLWIHGKGQIIYDPDKVKEINGSNIVSSQ